MVMTTVVYVKDIHLPMLKRALAKKELIPCETKEGKPRGYLQALPNRTLVFIRQTDSRTGLVRDTMRYFLWDSKKHKIVA